MDVEGLTAKEGRTMAAFLFSGLYFWIALLIAIGMVGSAKGRGGALLFLVPFCFRHWWLALLRWVSRQRLIR
jgi:hypothetical protein